jgi:hypothetical protein
MKIDWHGFLDEVVKPERSKQESCAWMFSEKPFSPDDVVHVVEVTNVGLKKAGNDISRTFAPDKKEFQKIKLEARRAGYTRIGNIHTHVVLGARDAKAIAAERGPSDTDLTYARRFNDVVRAVIVVVYAEEGKPGVIDGVFWHDQYGQKLDLEVDSVET